MRYGICSLASLLLIVLLIGCSGGSGDTEVAENDQQGSTPTPEMSAPEGYSGAEDDEGGYSGEEEEYGEEEYGEEEDMEGEGYDEEYEEGMEEEEGYEGYDEEYEEGMEEDEYDEEYEEEYDEEEMEEDEGYEEYMRQARGSGRGRGAATGMMQGYEEYMQQAREGGEDDYPEDYAEYDEAMESEYGEEYGEMAERGGPYPPGARPGAEPPRPLTLPEKAHVAFQQGRDREALQFLYAYALSSDEGAAEVLPKIHWVTALKQPRLAVRWGIGVHISPETYRGDIKPVGSVQQLPGRRSGGGSGYARGGPEGYGEEMGEGYESGSGMARGPSGGSTMLSRLTGELGTRFVTRYEELRSGGKFGEILQAVAATGGMSRGRAGGFAGPGLRSGAGYEAEYGEEYGEEYSEEFASEEGEESYEQAYRGSGGVRPEAPGASGLAGAGFRVPGAGPAAAPAGPSLDPVVPGISFLGVGARDELLSKAAASQIDVLVLFEVDVSFNRRTNLTTNKTEIHLLNVNPPKPEEQRLYRTKEFNNLKIQNERSLNRDDGVKDEFDDLFAYIEQNLTMTTLPAILSEKPEYVLGRVGALVNASYDNPLPVLVEIRFWQAQKLVRDADAELAIKKVIGEELGSQLVTGDAEARQKVLEQWLPAL